MLSFAFGTRSLQIITLAGFVGPGGAFGTEFVIALDNLELSLPSILVCRLESRTLVDSITGSRITSIRIIHMCRSITDITLEILLASFIGSLGVFSDCTNFSSTSTFAFMSVPTGGTFLIIFRLSSRESSVDSSGVEYSFSYPGSIL